MAADPSLDLQSSTPKCRSNWSGHVGPDQYFPQPTYWCPDGFRVCTIAATYCRPEGGGGRITERTPPAKRTLPATIKERVIRTRDARSGGAQGVDGRYNVWRSKAPGPHAHENAAKQVVDDRRAAEVRGQQKPSNNPHNNQHHPCTPTTGHR